MGSTGSGSFSDYDHSPKKIASQGSTSGEDKCNKSFSTNLEEVQNCNYYINHSSVPPRNTQVSIVFENPRLAVQDTANQIIGYLPTKYNYLLACMESGINYSGVVSASSLRPIPSVSVDISPI